MVFVNFHGEGCAILKRMKLNELKPAAIVALGGGGMIEFERERKSDTKLDAMLEQRAQQSRSESAPPQ